MRARSIPQRCGQGLVLPHLAAHAKRPTDTGPRHDGGALRGSPQKSALTLRRQGLGGDRRAQSGIGREHAVIAMAMFPWRRHQGGDLRDQFEWRQNQRRRACAGRCSTHRLEIAADQMLVIALVQMLQRERRMGTVAQQTFEADPVGTLDAHRAIDREAAVVRPGAHLGGLIFVDQAAPDEATQDTGSHAGRYVGKRRRVKFQGGMKADARRLVRRDDWREDPVDDAAMKTMFQCRLTSALSTLSEAAETKMHVLIQAEPNRWMKATAPIRAVEGQAGLWSRR